MSIKNSIANLRVRCNRASPRPPPAYGHLPQIRNDGKPVCNGFFWIWGRLGGGQGGLGGAKTLRSTLGLVRTCAPKIDHRRAERTISLSGYYAFGSKSII
jgi:hypothetical protein